MRKTFYLAVCLIVCVAASAQQRSLTIDIKSGSVKTFFRQVENKTGFTFAYNNSDINLSETVSVSSHGDDVIAVVNGIIANQGLRASIDGKRIIIHKVQDGVSESEADAQPVVIKGLVTDTDNQPLVGAAIQIHGTIEGVVSDIDGRFGIEVPKGTTLVVTCLGFSNHFYDAVKDEDVTFVLTPDILSLEEVVIVGYGTQSREKLTTSVAKLDNAVLENTPYKNVAAALQGGIPGMVVTNTSGEPSAAPRVILRGGTSINNPDGSSPMYVVDGVIREDLSHIPAEEISSMQVLKDAAATSIYGARASNGVVLVTTKGGQKGSVRIGFSYDLSVAQEPVQLDLVTAEEYILGARQSVIWAARKNPALWDKLGQAIGFGTGNDLTNNTGFTTQYLSDANRHKLDEGWKTVQDPYDPSKTIIYAETDYQSLRRRTALSHNYHLSASGGTDKVLYNVSLGYLDGEGTALVSDYKRLSTNMSGTVNVTDKISLTGRMNFSRVNSHAQTNGYNTFTRSAALPSTAKCYFEDGTIAPGTNSSLGNPLYYQTGEHAARRNTISTVLTIALSGKWEIIKGLTLEPHVSYYNTGSRFWYFQPGYLSSVTIYDETRPVTQNSSDNTRWQANAVLTYARTFGRHSVEGKVGYEYYMKQYAMFEAQGKGAATDNIPTLNAAAEPRNVTGYESEFVTEGVFGRINYDFDGRYLVSANFRYDGASNLGSERRRGFFPGISLGWNIHKEPFWVKNVPDNLASIKIRMSYGENGNIQGLSDYQAQGLYDASTRYDSSAAIRPSAIPNSYLAWEKSRTFDVGFDLGLFDRRVNMIFDYYDRLTSDLLADVVLPPSTGFSTVKTNNGSLRNEGVELGLTVNWLRWSSPVQWTSTFNFSKVRTRIVQLPYNGIENNRQGGNYIFDPYIGEYVWAGGLQEGGRVGDMFALHYEGVYATDEEAGRGPVNTYIRVSDKRSYAGDSIYRDMDQDGDIDSNDMYCVGNAYPTITGGINNTVTWNGLSLTLRLDYTLGHTIFSYANHFLDAQMQGDAMPTAEYYRNSWKKPGDNAKYPRYLWQDQQYNLGELNDLYYYKGDFLAIRELSLAYQFPAKLLNRIHMKGLRVNVTGNNLHYFTAYKGLNPESGGRDDGRYPNPRTFTFGVSITF